MKLQDTASLAAELQVPIRTLDQWAYLGKGPRFLRIGKHRRYRPEDVAAWLETRARGGAA